MGQIIKRGKDGRFARKEDTSVIGTEVRDKDNKVICEDIDDDPFVCDEEEGSHIIEDGCAFVAAFLIVGIILIFAVIGLISWRHW